jgi:hypothetical protein
VRRRRSTTGFRRRNCSIPSRSPRRGWEFSCHYSLSATVVLRSRGPTTPPRPARARTLNEVLEWVGRPRLPPRHSSRQEQLRCAGVAPPPCRSHAGHRPRRDLRRWAIDRGLRPEERATWERDYSPDPDEAYHRVWHEKLAFHRVRNGDLLAMDDIGRVGYFSHDGGARHGVAMAESFTGLLERWLPLCCPGPEDWQWSDAASGPPVTSRSADRSSRWNARVERSERRTCRPKPAAEFRRGG